MRCGYRSGSVGRGVGRGDRGGRRAGRHGAFGVGSTVGYGGHPALVDDWLVTRSRLVHGEAGALARDPLRDRVGGDAANRSVRRGCARPSATRRSLPRGWACCPTAPRLRAPRSRAVSSDPASPVAVEIELVVTRARPLRHAERSSQASVDARPLVASRPAAAPPATVVAQARIAAAKRAARSAAPSSTARRRCGSRWATGARRRRTDRRPQAAGAVDVAPGAGLARQARDVRQRIDRACVTSPVCAITIAGLRARMLELGKRASGPGRWRAQARCARCVPEQTQRREHRPCRRCHLPETAARRARRRGGCRRMRAVRTSHR
jgi:hypothetical protein